MKWHLKMEMLFEFSIALPDFPSQQIKVISIVFNSYVELLYGMSLLYIQPCVRKMILSTIGDCFDLVSVNPTHQKIVASINSRARFVSHWCQAMF